MVVAHLEKDAYNQFLGIAQFPQMDCLPHRLPEGVERGAEEREDVAQPRHTVAHLDDPLHRLARLLVEGQFQRALPPELVGGRLLVLQGMVDVFIGGLALQSCGDGFAVCVRGRLHGPYQRLDQRVRRAEESARQAHQAPQSADGGAVHPLQVELASFSDDLVVEGFDRGLPCLAPVDAEPQMPELPEAGARRVLREEVDECLGEALRAQFIEEVADVADGEGCGIRGS